MAGGLYAGRDGKPGVLKRPSVVSPDIPAEQLIRAGRTDELADQIDAIKEWYRD